MSPQDAYILGGLLFALLLWYPYCRYTYVQRCGSVLTMNFLRKSLLILMSGFILGLIIVAAL